MIHFLILHKTSRLKFDLTDIDRPDAHRLHIVTQAEGGVKLSDANWAKVDTRRTVPRWDHDTLRAVVAEAVGEWGREAVRIVSHDEYSLLLAAGLRAEFGLPGPDVEQTLRFTNKPLMKRLIAAAGLDIPRFVRLTAREPGRQPERLAARVAAVTSLPAFAKEVAGTCSERSARLDTLEQLTDWLADTPDLESFEVDEFLTGELLHVDCVIVSGRVVHAQATLDSFPNAETVSEKPLGSLTLPLESDLGRRMLAYNAACLDALRPLIDGTTHLEFFRTPDDRFVFLEIAARSPGGDCPRAYEINSGINFQSTYFQIHMGLPVSVRPSAGPYVAWCWYPRRTGTIIAVNEPEVSAKYEFEPELAIGQRITATNDTRLRSARVLLTGDEFEALAADFDYLRHEYEPFVYAPG